MELENQWESSDRSERLKKIYNHGIYHLNYASNHHLIPFYSTNCTKDRQISHK